MKKGWQTRTLAEVLEKTETVNPRQAPNVEFDYIDSAGSQWQSA